MKAAIASILLSLPALAQAAPIARCWSQESGIGLCVRLDEAPASNWKSLEILWTERDAGCEFGMNDRVKVRQFINSEIRRDDADRIVARQKNTFLFWGQKTTFSWDRKAGTAVIEGKNKDCLDVGQGCGGNPEPRGRYRIRFDRCETL
jgi:hypothetical protein